MTPRKVAWAEPSTTFWQMRGGGNPLPDDDQFWEGLPLWMRNHLQASLAERQILG